MAHIVENDQQQQVEWVTMMRVHGEVKISISRTFSRGNGTRGEDKERIIEAFVFLAPFCFMKMSKNKKNSWKEKLLAKNFLQKEKFGFKKLKFKIFKKIFNQFSNFFTQLPSFLFHE